MVPIAQGPLFFFSLMQKNNVPDKSFKVKLLNVLVNALSLIQ